MKKIISLQALMVMGLTLGAASFMEAYCQEESSGKNCNKYAHSKYEKEENRESKVARDKTLENSLKKEYTSIRRDFDKKHNVEAARAKLAAVDAKRKEFNARITKDEKHERLATMHKDSLHAMSKHLHEHITKYAREHKNA